MLIVKLMLSSQEDNDVVSRASTMLEWENVKAQARLDNNVKN